MSCRSLFTLFPSFREWQRSKIQPVASAIVQLGSSRADIVWKQTEMNRMRWSLSLKFSGWNQGPGTYVREKEEVRACKWSLKRIKSRKSYFSDFVFKIRLIRLDFFLSKNKILVFEPPVSGVLTTTPQSPLWVGDTEKLPVTFSHAWLILVEFT